MSKLFNWAAARLAAAFALALCFATPLVSWADAITAVNPVTGETETYANTFLGTNSSEWNAAGNWDTDSVPFVSGGTYTSALVDGKTVTSSADMDLWHGQIGAYNGASITIPGITKIQASGGFKVFLTADRTSKITINAFRGNQLQGSASLPIELTSAQEGGITWNCGLTTTTDSSAPFHYYIDAINNGSVVYTGNITVANEQVIKQVNVKLTGTSQVSSKTLVTFGSGTTKSFTADAAIKVYDTDGTTLVETVNLAEVKNASTLTTSDPVGSCELVQTSTGIVLYYVDGNPSAVVAKTYKPSININFTHSGGNLTTSADVGLAPYTVPGTVWNNYAVPANGATSTQTSVYSIDATGTKSLVSGATVSISGTRGSYRCNSLTAASDLRHGYIDETATAGQNTPTVVVSGIPFDRYTVVVYTAADTENATFNYITVNGTDYTYVNGKLATGTSAWGNAGAADSANALAEGVNVLVSPVLRGSTATIVGHKASNTCRGNIAAVQIVEYTPEIGENDLVIELDGDKTHTFEEAKTYDTVYVTGSGTLTFAGTDSTATTLDISGSAAVNMNGSSLTPTAVTGTGTAIYTGVLPTEGLGWTASAWYGTVWIKNYTTKVASFQSNKYGNAASTLRLTGMNGYFDYKWTGDNATAKYSQNVAIELVDDGDTPAFTYNDGWEKTVIYFAKLKGAGTLRTAGSGNKQTLYFANADEFTGTFDLAAQKIQIGGDEQANKDTTAGNGKLIVAGTSAMTANVKTANGGIYITGTLNGSIATTNTVTISGTMNITGAVTTEAIISVENGGALNIANGGTLKLTRNTDDDGINPYAGVTIKSGATCTIASGGTITTDNSVTSTYYQFVVNGSMTVAGAFTTVADVAVNAGGSLTITGTMKAYWGIANSGTITLNGIDNVPAYASGYPTTITNSDTGVVKLTSTGSVDDSTKDYSAITGTGTIEYCGSSWRSLPQTMFAPTLSVVANQADGVVAKHNNTVIGSLSGEKNLRSDLGDSGKTLTIKQAKDGVWSGIFKGGTDRLATIVVAPGDSTTGTLTLAGTQDQANWTDALTVSGSVNLTGTWQGDTTVSGTFGGTGTLTGNLTFSDGATFKAFASDDEDGLVVSGTVGYPAEGTVTVDVSAIEPEADVALIKAAGLNRDKFALADGTPEGYSLDVVEGVLTLKVPVNVTITVPTVENATVAVTVGGVAVQPITEGGNTYQVEAGSVVIVTYAAASGYAISGTTQYTIDTTTETTFEITDTATAQYVARVYNYGTNQNEGFTSLNAAIAVADGTTYANTITLLADITDAVTIDKAIYLAGQGKTNSAAVTISSGGYLSLMGPTLTGKLTIGANGAFAQVGTGSVLPEVETQDGASIALNTLSADTVALTVTKLTVNGTLTLSSTAQGTERGTPYKAFSYVTANATFGEGAEIVGGGVYSASTEVEGDNTVVSMTITAVAKIGDEYYDDLDEAVADAIANDTVVELLIQPEAAVALGVGQTLKVKAYSYTLEVNLASGLTNPPYSISSSLNTDTTITTYTVNAAFAKIGNTTYPTLAAAIEAATSGDTVTLLADVMLTDKLVVSNKTVTITADSAKTITGQLRVVDGSNVTIGENVTITSDKHPTVFVLGDPVVKTAGTAKSTLVVNGTVLNTNAGFDKTFAIAGNGLDTKGVDITINGTVRNANGIAIYQAFPGDLVVNGTVEGASAISIKDGTLTVNSGAVVRATLASGAAYVGNNNGDSPTGDAIIAPYYDLSRGYGTPVVSIAGGEITVTDTENCMGIEAYDFEGATAPNDSASNVNVSGGTFNTAVADTYCAEGFEPKDNGDGTYGVRVDKGWVYSAPGDWDYTGTWTEGAALGDDKVTISDGATYSNRTASAGQLVTVAMTLSFDDVNDEDSDFGDAKAAIRLASGETDGTYQFQLYTSDGENKVWTNATVVGVTATKDVDYNFVFVLDLTNKTYTASIVSGATTNALSIGESVTKIPFACQDNVTPVQRIDFVGSGTVSSIEGSYETPEPPPAGFVEDEEVTLLDGGKATLTEAQAEWLNACGDKAAVNEKIATMTEAAFNNAYLLNLNIAGDFSYEFGVSDFKVDTAAGKATVYVTLTRTGALAENEVAKPIIGTLKLTGTAEIGTAFAEIGSADLIFDANANFGNGATTTAVTVDIGENGTGAKFYLPVIE